MDVERRLLSKVLMDRNIRPMVDAKIQPDFFQDEAHARLWEWMVEYFTRYGTSPTARALQRNHPEFRPLEVSEPIEWLIDQLLAAREYAVMAQAVAESSLHLKEGETAKARQVMHQAMGTLAYELSPFKDINLSDPAYIQKWIEEYEELEAFDGDIIGLPTGFPVMDRATGGLRPEQLITLIGEPKAGKSTGLLLMYKAVHDSGAVPLFVGFEMSNEEQRTRYAAIRAGVNYHRLDRGLLNKEEKQRFLRSLRELENTPDLWMAADRSATSTVSGIIAKLEAIQPAALFIDGVYLMVDEISGEQNTPTALTNISRSLKRTAQRYRIPVTMTTQALTWKVSRKKGLTTDSIGYTSAIGQDSDIIFGLESTDQDDIKRLKVVAARNMKNRVVLMSWSWSTLQFEEMEHGPDDEDDEDFPA